jgi:hypothetical protein
MFPRTITLGLALLAAATACAGCDRHAPPAGQDQAARADAAVRLRALRFEEADPATQCQPDCREQERGFDYARKGRIDQPGDCDLARARVQASDDFIEGCRAYGQYIEAAARGR